jgi:signal transduction histidine kinase
VGKLSGRGIDWRLNGGVMSLADKSTLGLAWSAGRQASTPLQGPLVVAIAYYLGAEVAFYIGTLSDKIFAIFWPPNVILFCALVIAPQRRWWLYIAAVLPAHVIAEHGVGMPAPQIIVAFATNCMVALLNAYAVRRFVGDPPWFGTFQKAALYIIIAVGPCPALSAFGGAFVPILGGSSLADDWLFWSHWYLANALPNLTLGPVFLIWFSDGAKWSRWALSRQWLEPVVLAVALFGISALVATVAGRLGPSGFASALLLMPLPPALWAAIRFGEKGASGAILILTVVLTWHTLHVSDLPFGPNRDYGLLALQIFLMALAMPILLLGALIDEVRRAEQVTRRLAASLLTAQDDERRRIARDLHDATGQNLIAATLISGQIYKTLPPSGQRILNQLEDVLQQAIREIRTVSYLLHPPLLDEAGLELALRDYVCGYSERSGIEVSLNVAPNVDRLPPDTELVLFRVVQEALTNVARHSKSTTAHIELSRRTKDSGEQIELTIEDAGTGMPAVCQLQTGIGRKAGSGSASGIGLVSMRERLYQVGGSLVLDSQVVRAVIPVLRTNAD